jgi:hypothetical protein
MKKTKGSKKKVVKKPKASAKKKVAVKAKLAPKKKPVVKAKSAAKAKPMAKTMVKAKSAPAVKMAPATKNAPVVKMETAAKSAPVAKATAKKKAPRVAPPMVQAGSQDVETVQVKGKARVARAGAGGGDFGGASVVEGANSESVDELLEEGQAFEAGIVGGVESADDEVEQEVHTHEVPQDDVPGEYDEDNKR